MKTASNGESDNNHGSKKQARFCLHNMQSSSSRKENMVGVGRTSQQMVIDGKTAKPEQTLLETEVCDSVKETSSVAMVNPTLYKKLVTDNLISATGPTEKYWEVTAERLRKSLENELEEGARLQAIVFALEEENLACKALVENTTDLLNTLKEFVNVSQSSIDADESSNQQEDSFSSVEHIHKKMKISNSDDSDSD